MTSNWTSSPAVTVHWKDGNPVGLKVWVQVCEPTGFVKSGGLFTAPPGIVAQAIRTAWISLCISATNWPHLKASTRITVAKFPEIGEL